MAKRTFSGKLAHVELKEGVEDFSTYPFSIPAVSNLGRLAIDPRVTFLIGENGSGKSTLLEAIAIALGVNPEGGTKNFRFTTRASHSSLHQSLRAARTGPIRDIFFLRAESLFNLATEIERLDSDPLSGPPIIDSYGGVSLHEQSHGESFLAVASNRFGRGLFLLDEPESALSPSRQLAFLSLIRERVATGEAQFVIATHSPILLAYPGARIYELGQNGIEPVSYEDSFVYNLYRDFLTSRGTFLAHLGFGNDDGGDD